MLLFLSHSGADTAAAVELKRRILAASAAGLQVWLDKDNLRPGPGTWQKQLSDALSEATAFCVYVGSGDVVNWVEREAQRWSPTATTARCSKEEGDLEHERVLVLRPQ